MFSFSPIYSQCNIILDDNLGICPTGQNVSLADYFEVNAERLLINIDGIENIIMENIIIHYTASDMALLYEKIKL